MTTYKKTVKPPAPVSLPPIYTASDLTRTFDARPKANEGRRREDSVRPTQHVDQFAADPLDAVAED